MFKKFLTVFVAFVAVLSLASCKKDEERTYVADGKYTAFKTEVHSGAPMVTSVTVTIKDDKVESFFIDCTQGTKDAATAGAANFNTKSKKELGYEYKMHYNTYVASLDDASTATMEGYKAWLTAEGKKEWFEQANLIEAAWLANGVDSVTVVDGKINNVAGVTIKDGSYVELAKEAVANAKSGKVQAYATLADDIVWATATVDKDGKLSDIKIDCLQGKAGNADTAWAWNTQSKQELGYGYKMHYRTYTSSLDDASTATMEGYKTWLAAEGKKEWFEQVALIVNAWVADSSLQATEGKFPTVSGVTISDNAYITVLNGVAAAVRK